MSKTAPIYLQSIARIDSNPDPDGFPFSVPVIESLEKLEFDHAVTFFVGENGSGKSTLLESIAYGMRATSMGSHELDQDNSMANAEFLARRFRFSRNRKPSRAMFFRAEDAFGFTKRLQKEMRELGSLEREFEGSLQGYGKILATGAVRGQSNALENMYGTDPHAQSHGELFLSLLRTRIKPNGLYLLDEPEAPLSPIYQLSLLSLIKQGVEELNSQFIIATHSPMLMALPGAILINFDTSPLDSIAWEDVEHVAITRAFLNNPNSFLQHL